jgi:class 3 adenylate cyclase
MNETPQSRLGSWMGWRNLKERQMANDWKYDRAIDHIRKKIADVKDVTIKDYVRDMTLENIKTNEAYRVDGVHLYVDIRNMDEILGTTETEGVTSHKRTLRFLNQHYRATGRILNETGAKRIDFHNQRLHAVITKPYNTEENAETSRIHQAVAIAQLMIDVLLETGDADELIPSASVRIGIDSGKALAVNNGRNGYREPLFLGEPANHAAKHASGDSEGIYLTNNARKAIGLETVSDSRTVVLTADEVKTSQEKAKLTVTKDSIVKEWKDDLDKHPPGSFEFFRQTPPLRDLDIGLLTPKNSRRQEAISVYADIAGFTAYVTQHIDEDTEDVVRTLHVLRAELERVFTSDFGGRRIRFIGDCIHGLVCEGTALTTDEEKTISNAVLCAGGLRSSFDEALIELKKEKVETGSLGLAIGFEYGPMTVTRLGIHGDRVRCSVSRGVLQGEEEQLRCSGVETAIGPEAYKNGTEAVRNCFGPRRIKAMLNYNEAVEVLAEKGDATAESVRKSAVNVAASATNTSRASSIVRPYCD